MSATALFILYNMSTLRGVRIIDKVRHTTAVTCKVQYVSLRMCFFISGTALMEKNNNNWPFLFYYYFFVF